MMPSSSFQLTHSSARPQPSGSVYLAAAAARGARRHSSTARGASQHARHMDGLRTWRQLCGEGRPASNMLSIKHAQAMPARRTLWAAVLNGASRGHGRRPPGVNALCSPRLACFQPRRCLHGAGTRGQVGRLGASCSARTVEELQGSLHARNRSKTRKQWQGAGARRLPVQKPRALSYSRFNASLVRVCDANLEAI